MKALEMYTCNTPDAQLRHSPPIMIEDSVAEHEHFRHHVEQTVERWVEPQSPDTEVR